MISLPVSLSSWSRQLRVFPPELQIAVGRLVQRIAVAIEPIHPKDFDRGDDPDGFNGLVNRGSYDHLIAADWLLAEEEPEEFERRAAMHEHLFLNTARRDHAHGLGSIVLFDAGPDQIGSPRIAHLALAIVLLRRAENSRARFSWGILQDPALRSYFGSNEAEIMQLLQARTYSTPSQSQIHEWVGRALKDHQPHEVWLVGGARLRTLTADSSVSQIKVEDTLDPETRQVLVEVQRGRGRARRIILDLPENNICARLLRDPFEIRTAKPQLLPGGVPASALVCAHGGRRILASAGKGHLISVAVPNVPLPEPGKVKHHILGDVGQVVAANIIDRSTVFVVTLKDGLLRLVQIGRPNYPAAGNYTLERGHFDWPANNESGLLFPCVRPPEQAGEDSNLLVLDAAQNLFRLREKWDRLTAQPEASKVLALTIRNGIPFYIAISEERRTELTIPHKRHRRGADWDFPAYGGAFFGFGADVKGPFPLAAIGRDPLSWLIVQGFQKRIDVTVDASQKVVGVIQEKSYAEALVTLRDENHTLTLKAPNWERLLFESADALDYVTVFEGKPLIAYATTRHLAVFSLPLNQHLCRYTRFGNE